MKTFIKEKFGSDCKLSVGEYLSGSDNEGIYKYQQIAWDIKSNCNIARVLYFKGIKKVMAMNGAQECRFSATVNDQYGAICYDDLIINSFNFTGK